jgi:UDP-N-acetylmuramoyl-L-alanyl-D-glutamate--2,6-diaminopimelate ligase
MSITDRPQTVAEYAALLKGSQISGDTYTPVTGICRDSRIVKPGDLFVCIKGATFDGHAAAAAAIDAGAAGIVAERGGLDAAGVSLANTAAVITVKNSREALALASCAFHGNPSHSLKVIGVTGTNGKTTCTRMIAAILRQHGMSVGTIGTLGAELNGEEIPSEHTTPEADQLQSLLADMRSRGAQAVVMEVSSHAIALNRTDGIAFQGAVFTNLTQDHLDFHGTMEAYYNTKALLFSKYPIAYPRPDKSAFIAVITISQWEGRELVTEARGDIVTFATDDSPAVVTAKDIALSASSTAFTVVYDAGISRYEFPVNLPIGGAFQVGNALGAIGMCLRLGVSKETIAAALASLPGVPGRFQSVPAADLGCEVIVDYAHTPDGLENVLKSARELSPTRLITVFGCGGNRDRTKRPIMGRLAASLSNIAIVTSDNPRNESPDAIISEILEGMNPASDPSVTADVLVEPDRRKAIFKAIEIARPGDIVIIAGKGHETYQIVGDQVLNFDDCKVAAEAIANHAKAGVSRT